MSHVTFEPEFPPSPAPAMADRAEPAERRHVPDARDHRLTHGRPIHVTVDALELETLADHHMDLVAGFRAEGNHETGDMMEARAAELRRLAERARAGR